MSIDRQKAEVQKSGRRGGTGQLQFYIMKMCKECKHKKPVTDFYTNGKYIGKNKVTTKYKPVCKQCDRSTSREALKQVILDFYGSWKCQDCGFTGHSVQFDCHHVNPKQKEFEISRDPRKAINSKNRLIKELEKCVLICANCHRLRHVK